MNLKKLYEILKETTVELRKGNVLEEHDSPGVKVVEIYLMPHESEVIGVEKVDVHFMVVGVRKELAENRREEFVNLVSTYPDFERFKNGLSYIELGGVIRDQGVALRFMALGKVLGMWDIITPERLGFSGEEAHTIAGRGLVMIAGYKL